MDSKKRHELETNDLREFLDNFKDFWDKNGNSILIALIVVVGGYAAYNWYNKNQSTKQDNASQALVDANGGAVLLGVAEEHPRVKDEARRRAGDAFLAEARAAAAEGDADEKAKKLDSAEAAYNALLADTDHDAYKVNAYLGLAVAAEMRAQWDKAKDYYTQAGDLAGDRYEHLADIARTARDKVDELRDIVAFGPDVPDTPDPLPGATDLPGINPLDPDDLNGNGIPDRLERPEDMPAPGTTPGTSPGTSPGNNPLFPEDDPALPGIGGDEGTGSGEGEPPAIDPLLLPDGNDG